MHLIGVEGMPRRVADYPEQFAGWNLFISLSSFVLGLSTLVFLYNIVASWRGGPRAVANPWRALTLEWQVSSPPPIFNFDAVPTVVGGPYEYGVPGRGARHLPARGPGGATTHAGGGVERLEREDGGLRCRTTSCSPTRRSAAPSCSTRSASSRPKGDAHFHVVVPLTAAAPRQRDLRRGGARRRAGARRPRAGVHARRGHRRHRRGGRPGPVQRGDGRPARAPDRRDHRLDAAGRPPRAGCGAT